MNPKTESDKLLKQKVNAYGTVNSTKNLFC